MPELPEVQTIVNDLSRKIVGRKIVDVWTDWSKTVKKPSFKIFQKEIKGLKIEKIERRGKNILIYLSGGRLLLIHLKMTGHLLLGKWRIKKILSNKYQVRSEIKGALQEKVNNYIHVIFYFDNRQEMGLSDLRKFAKILFGSREEVLRIGEIHKIGPEPLSSQLSINQFISLISSQKRKIKQVLMDPKVIAGIGNIYSDDILWMSKIHPFTPAYKLKTQELKNLYKATRLILKKALKLRGTSVSDFRDPAGKSGFYGDKRLVYQREDEGCGRCGTPIKRLKIGGRSAHFCPRCQKI